MSDCPNRDCKGNDFHGRCCCNCEHRLTDYSHPCSNGGSCLDERGYICYVDGMAFSGWHEHGLCELHDYKVEPVRYSILHIPSGEFVAHPDCWRMGFIRSDYRFKTPEIDYANAVLNDVVTLGGYNIAEFEIIEV